MCLFVCVFVCLFVCLSVRFFLNNIFNLKGSCVLRTLKKYLRYFLSVTDTHTHTHKHTRLGLINSLKGSYLKRVNLFYLSTYRSRIGFFAHNFFSAIFQRILVYFMSISQSTVLFSVAYKYIGY